jgi:DNA (cytosine-5)-methyltransferase 1
MSNHQNRGPQGPSSNPTAGEIRAAREAVQLSQTDAAALIHASLGAWQKWEQGDRRMHPAFWELFQLKIGVGS